jgi:hypothetical protein
MYIGEDIPGWWLANYDASSLVGIMCNTGGTVRVQMYQIYDVSTSTTADRFGYLDARTVQATTATYDLS